MMNRELRTENRELAKLPFILGSRFTVLGSSFLLRRVGRRNHTLYGCFLAAVTVFVTAGAAPAQQMAARDVTIEQRLDSQVPLDLVFRDEHGNAKALREYFQGKPVILVLAWYRCPRLCSLVLNGLVESLRQIDYEIGDQFTVITVSIDPRETPGLAAAKQKSYAQQYGRPGAVKNWHFLTGEESNIKRLADAVGYQYVYDAERDQFSHASGIMVLTAEGKIARYFYGVEFPSRDLRFGLEDASAGKIGSPVTRPLRLLCFAYDPTTGKYGLLTIRLVQVGGVLTILALGIFLLRAWRHERRRSAASSSTTTG
jgi:protein SCO1/2